MRSSQTSAWQRFDHAHSSSHDLWLWYAFVYPMFDVMMNKYIHIFIHTYKRCKRFYFQNDDFDASESCSSHWRAT